MANVVLAWEMGEGIGHASRLVPLARGLAARGHRVAVAAQNPAALVATGLEPGVGLWQAPLWPRTARPLPAAASYAEMLARLGYDDANALAAALRVWRDLLAAARADLLVCEHSPTAQIAARGLGLPCVAMGTGFTCPPRTDPMPTLAPWRPPSPRLLAETEAAVLGRVGDALAALGLARPGRFADLFAADETVLCTLPELDPFAAYREGARYAGPHFTLGLGAPPRWPRGPGPAVFGYLKCTYARIDAVLADLGRHLDGARLLAYVAGAGPDRIRRWQGARLAVTPRPVDLGAARRECAAAICHAGHGTIAAMALAGRPLVLVPAQVEQALNARAVAAAGLGIAVDPGASAGRALARALADPGYAQRARALAERYEDLTPEAAEGRVIEAVEAVLDGGVRRAGAPGGAAVE